ncbi:protein kinase subdomain-containing protein [Paraphaeosphaeria minitans]|uniref:Protein kinase subdomain-containing protein n=1 Tax=Paraphaeosphaeria minitans TaxID=565426 RepID=A0A9P6G7I5_9PLEO|nr:protein kinase subdomain-containing protein [Paraphaeosphaeria minitans]
MDGVQTEVPDRPCEYFDLICGTSTGGLIAIMLGRLAFVSIDRVPIQLKLIILRQSTNASLNTALWPREFLAPRERPLTFCMMRKSSRNALKRR